MYVAVLASAALLLVTSPMRPCLTQAAHEEEGVVEQAPYDFIIDVPVFIDQPGFLTWKRRTGKSTKDELKTEITSLLVEVQEVYKSLYKFGDMKIEFHLLEITFIDAANPWGYGRHIQGKTLLSKFQRWLTGQRKSYDIGLLFTGYDMASSDGSNGAVGYANLGAICTDRSVVAVELTGSYIDPLITAHEIGHVLGAQHDGLEGATKCSPSGYNVMTPGLNVYDAKHFHFSNCSYNMIYNTLVDGGKGHECLQDTDHKDIVTAPRLGSLLTPDEMCRREREDKDAVVDRKLYADHPGQLDNICVYLNCSTYKNEKWATTHQGMSCGQDKHCVQGKCVDESGHSSTDSDKTVDSCPFGDQAGPVSSTKRGKTYCADLPLSACAYWSKSCCKRCAGVATSEPDLFCQKEEGSESMLNRDKYETYGDTLCNGLYCTTGFGGSFRSKKYDTPDGMPCAKGKVCQSKKCVVASPSKSTGIVSDSCPFGSIPWIPGSYSSTCDGDFVLKRYGCNWRWSKLCCQTCSKYNV